MSAYGSVFAGKSGRYAPRNLFPRAKEFRGYPQGPQGAQGPVAGHARGYGPSGPGAAYGPYGPSGPAAYGPYGPASPSDCDRWSVNAGQCDSPSSRYYVTSASVPPASGYIDRKVTYNMCAKLYPFASEYYYQPPVSCSSSSSSCSEHEEAEQGAHKKKRSRKSDRDCCTGRRGTGNGRITVTINRCSNTATVEGHIEYAKLSSEVIGVEICGPSDPNHHDLCGAVLIDCGRLYRQMNGDLSCYVTFLATVKASEAEDILRGRYFIQVRTCEYKSGEIKGRIVPGFECCD